MNEFSLIEHFFQLPAITRKEVIVGIGDDAACVTIPLGCQLLITTDSLVQGTHFLADWEPYDLAFKAVMVNISDIAAMAGKPCWALLSLTMPSPDQIWLTEFAKGLHTALRQFSVALIGGNIARGPLNITITMHGLVPSGKALLRKNAKSGDLIYISGQLGAAALALTMQDNFANRQDHKDDYVVIRHKLTRPLPRVDLIVILQQYASAAIDLSDGLCADLAHICTASKVGALLHLDTIPIHELVLKYNKEHALSLALSGGDDYELCFTVPPAKKQKLLASLQELGLRCYLIGAIEKKIGIRGKTKDGTLLTLQTAGYKHF